MKAYIYDRQAEVMIWLLVQLLLSAHGAGAKALGGDVYIRCDLDWSLHASRALLAVQHAAPAGDAPGARSLALQLMRTRTSQTLLWIGMQPVAKPVHAVDTQGCDAVQRQRRRRHQVRLRYICLDADSRHCTVNPNL